MTFKSYYARFACGDLLVLTGHECLGLNVKDVYIAGTIPATLRYTQLCKYSYYIHSDITTMATVPD